MGGWGGGLAGAGIRGTAPRLHQASLLERLLPGCNSVYGILLMALQPD